MNIFSYLCIVPCDTSLYCTSKVFVPPINFCTVNNKLYVKLPIYVGEFLRWKYTERDDNGRYKNDYISLPPTLHKAGELIYINAISNPMMKPIATLSYSYRAMSIEKAYIPRDMLDGLPDDDARKFMFAFELPEEHIVGGRFVGCTECMQLTQKDASKFADIVTDEMFEDLERFRKKEWERWAAKMGYERSDFTNMLGCWMNRRNIDQDHFENILRVCRRAQEKAGNRPKDVKQKAKTSTY